MHSVCSVTVGNLTLDADCPNGVYLVDSFVIYPPSLMTQSNNYYNGVLQPHWRCGM